MGRTIGHATGGWPGTDDRHAPISFLHCNEERAMSNDKDNLKGSGTTPQSSRDAGRFEGQNYTSPAPPQSWERPEDTSRRQAEYDKTRRGS